jgi:hypothetical protein
MFDIRLPSRDLIADSIEAVCNLHFLFLDHALAHHTAYSTKQVTLVRRREQYLGLKTSAHSTAFFSPPRPSTMMATYPCLDVTRICQAVRLPRYDTTVRRSSCMVVRYRSASDMSIARRWDTRKAIPSISRTRLNRTVNRDCW